MNPAGHLAAAMGVLGSLGLTVSSSQAAGPAPPSILFATGFEPTEGYSTNSFFLIGTNGWVGIGSGGNGISAGNASFAGLGQQAYIGYYEPTNANDIDVYLWHPINLAPIPTNTPIIQFRVLMEIVDSYSTANRDSFRWSVYNTNGNRLFTLDFDNETFGINYILDDGQIVATSHKFTNSVRYDLLIAMDFPSNRWNATLDGGPIVTNQPITTKNAPRNLGDVDAVWLFFNPAAPGDNYMLFDNYQVLALRRPPPPVPPRLETIGQLTNGRFALRLFGEPGGRYAIDGSTNSGNWIALKTNVAMDGWFDFVDLDSPALPQRIYRARFVP